MCSGVINLVRDIEDKNAKVRIGVSGNNFGNNESTVVLILMPIHLRW